MGIAACAPARKNFQLQGHVSMCIPRYVGNVSKACGILWRLGYDARDLRGRNVRMWSVSLPSKVNKSDASEAQDAMSS